VTVTGSGLTSNRRDISASDGASAEALSGWGAFIEWGGQRLIDYNPGAFGRTSELAPEMRCCYYVTRRPLES